MASSEVASRQPAATTESKASKKKTKNQQHGNGSPRSPSLAPPPKDSADLKTPPNEGVDMTEKEHIREVQKHIRNVNKKLNSMQKLDAVIKENPGVSLDDLVATRKINNDQKAQALKKPMLQSQLASLEDQLATYKKLDAEYAVLMNKEKESLLASHASELEKVKAEIQTQAKGEAEKAFKSKLLCFSRFLAAAARRRNNGEDVSDDGRAFEGVLLLVYGGDVTAVEAAEKLVNGAEEEVPTVDGTTVGVSFARIKQLSLEETDTEDPWKSSNEVNFPPSGSDPTVAQPTFSEQIDSVGEHITNGANNFSVDAAPAPTAAGIDTSAANAVAETQWDSSKHPEDPLSESYEIIPRDPAEVESTTSPAIRGITAQQSWADDQPTEQSWTPDMSGLTINGGGSGAGTGSATTSNDGFHEVTHKAGRSRGGSGYGGQRGGQRGGARGGRGGGAHRGGEGFRGRGRGFRGRRGD